MSRVLLTGATGFLGRHVLCALERARPGVTVVGLARRPAGLPPPVRPIAGAVERPDAWSGHPDLVGVDTIVHLAARQRHTRSDADATHAVNVDGTLAMVDLAARLGARLVFVSTAGTVGVFTGPRGWADEHSPFAERLVARWPYYASKLLAERRATRRCRDLGVELVILRPPTLLGPDAPSEASVRPVARILDGGPAVSARGGMHFVDVRAVASAVVAATSHPSPRPVYHLPGTQLSQRSFAHQVAALAGAQTRSRTVPWRALHPLARASRRLAGARSPLPDPVQIELAGHWWGLRSRFADELCFRPPPADVTLADPISGVRASRGIA